MTMIEAVATRIDDLLKERNMSRRQLAEDANLPFETIGSIFKKLAKSVTLSTLGALCAGLGMTMSEFLDSKYFKRAEDTPDEPVA